MTIVKPNPAGLDRLQRSLDAGRPRSQPVGVGIRSLDPIIPAMELDAETIDLVDWLRFASQVSVLVPVSAAAPPWPAPATVDGMASMAGT